ncbi:LacI family transcriptional regulator [Phytoactinopolyspora alkaliphila]|uniref:LacI family transcriptional regulator n=1 Tax=Phytoactinopolyspora alkaliphila TaxID=1783498 RepID=A0A6N9YS20_9ACTN|nr:LacI family DNA-binding transcriptional regulator [Phytoactinopolyspora alkaliphila]NED97856.1 LacI family transcriptional regulator [Phytoactinopolyspora alkaliphila]
MNRFKDGGGDERKLTGIREVARIAGVSVGTVSNVLNRPDVVAEATRQRVHAVIEQLEFVPNRGAADLRSGRSRMIGLVVPDITNPFFAEVARGAVNAANEDNIAVVLCNSDHAASQEDRYLDVLEQHRVAGVLINPLGKVPSRLESLRDRGLKVVCVDRSVRKSAYCSVSVDDVRGGEIAVEHLLAPGARRLVLVNGPASLRPCADRRRGAWRALDKAGLSRDSLTEVVCRSMTIRAGVEAGARMLQLPELPDAVFCTNDLLAIGVMRALVNAGVGVPGDVAIVGYDDIDLAADAAVPLTSVSQPKFALGRKAMQLLLAEIAEGSSHEHERIAFQPDLTVRDSSAAPKAG